VSHEVKPVDSRKGEGHSAAEIVGVLRGRLMTIPGGLVISFEPPAIQGIGSFGGL
jgi:HAE1 family hydrophobic/amphiphilic exporter-1